MGIIAGTTTPIQIVVAQPLIDPMKSLWTGSHLVPGLFVLESNAGNMGNALGWVARLIYPDHPPTPQAAQGAGDILSKVGTSIFHASGMRLPVGDLTLSTLNRKAKNGD